MPVRARNVDTNVAGCFINIAKFPRELFLNRGLHKYYAMNVYNRVLIGTYVHLRRHFVKVEDVELFINNYPGYREKLRAEGRYSSPLARENTLNSAFCAYLEWMSKHNFQYTPNQCCPKSFDKLQGDDKSHAGEMRGAVVHPLEGAPYTLFYQDDSWLMPDTSKPQGNCTDVNLTFCFLLQCLGFHPDDLGITSILSADNFKVDGQIVKNYVIAKPKVSLEQAKEAGEISDRFASKLNIKRYKSKIMVLLPRSCEVVSSPRETPFPNHQYALVEASDIALQFPYYDARNGFRYSDSWGIFEFWRLVDKVIYRGEGGVEREAEIIAPQGPLGDAIGIQLPEVCWKSVAKVTGKKPSHKDYNPAAWLYADIERYGPMNTAVPTKRGTILNLSPDIAALFGYFIPNDISAPDLRFFVNKALRAYEGKRHFFTSSESTNGQRVLRSIIASQQPSEQQVVEFGVSGETRRYTRDEIIDILYQLMGSVSGEYAPLKRPSALRTALIDAFNLPSYYK